jgi:PEP-CTERM motif
MKTSFKNKAGVLAGAALVSCGLFGSSAHAAVLAYEPFSYSTGSLIGAGPGTGFTGTWSQNGAGGSSVTTGSLSYSTLPTAGNEASLDNANKRDTENLMTPAGGVDGDTVWVSYLLESPGATAQGADYMGLVLNGSVSDDFFGYTGVAPTQFTAGVGIATATSSPLAITPVGTAQTQEASNQALFLVAEVQYASGGDTVSLYINPSLSSGPGTPVSTYTQATSIGTINAIGLQGSGSGLYDEIRVGDTFADVTGGSAVPEPASIGLLGIAGLGLLGRRRQSK